MVQKKIVCIGDVFVDILPSIVPIEKSKILLDGETFVDSIVFQKGGCAGNFSCVLKSVMPLAEISLVSRLGRLPYSDFLISEIEKYGVVPIFQIDDLERTQVSMALSYSDGQRHFLTCLGGLKNFAISDIPKEIFTDIQHLALRGIWFMEKILLKLEILIEKANSLGVDVSIDLGFDPYWNFENQDSKFKQITQRRRFAVLNIIKKVKYIFGNESEFMHLTNTESLDAAIEHMVNIGSQNIIIHRGENGCRIIQCSKSNLTKKISSVNLPALKVVIKNPVGSGDAFDSIFLAEVLEGKNLIKAAAVATAGAAFSLSSGPGVAFKMNEIRTFCSKFSELVPFLKNT